MLVNRIGDFSLILGAIIIYIYIKSLDYATTASLAPAVALQTIHFLNLNCGLLDLIGVLLFIGAVGKSAQIGLHT
jgi:NADH-quinone oxidoreductase subunit L